MMPNFAYLRPRDLEEAVREAGREGTRLHAGGTDLLGCLRDGVFGAERLLSLRDLSDLRGVRPDGRGLRIGALTTIAEVERQELIRARWTALAEAAAEVASPQLRNQGTLGGNLCQKPRCWYYRGEFACLRKGGEDCFAVGGQNRFHCILGGDGCFIVHPSDPAVALVALEARVRVQGPRGRRLVEAAAFHVPPAVDPRRETVLGPGEIVTEVLLPEAPPGRRSSFRKVRARRSWDFALASVAVVLDLEGGAGNGASTPRVRRARIVLGGVAPVPWRAAEAEKEIEGAPLDEAAIGRAAAAAVARAEPLAQNGYKLDLVQGLLTRELGRLAGA